MDRTAAPGSRGSVVGGGGRFRVPCTLLGFERGSRGVYEVVSGYRSPTTNAALRSNSSGVARRSLHMEGRAIDVRLSDVETADLREIALGLRRGGVGYYAKSDFVHLDTGRFRTW